MEQATVVQHTDLVPIARHCYPWQLVLPFWQPLDRRHIQSLRWL